MNKLNQPFSIGPGPYDFRLSSCGVDETFEVYCQTTYDVIARFRFWEARDRCLGDAMILTAALEMLRENRRSEAEYGYSDEELAAGVHLEGGKP